jgi:hypothetical protein
MPEDSEKLKRYLLGGLDGEEAKRIDLKIIGNESFADELSLAESELIEDYLEDELADEDRTLFFENFLTSADRRRSLEEIARLKRYASASAAEATRKKGADGRFTSGLASLLSHNWRMATAVTAVAVVVVGLVLWAATGTPKLTPLESEYAALNRQDLTDLQDYREMSSFSLVSGTFRDSASTGKVLTNADLTETVMFRLDVPQGAAQVSDADLVREGNPVFKLAKLRSYQNGSGMEVRLLLPKAVLTRGRYRLRLSDPSDPEISIPYDFAVE